MHICHGVYYVYIVQYTVYSMYVKSTLLILDIDGRIDDMLTTDHGGI